MENAQPELPASLPSRASRHVRSGASSQPERSYKWVSAGVVSFLAALSAGAAASGLPAWSGVIVLALAGGLFAAGWGRLAGAPLLLPSQILIGLAALASGITVSYVQDQFATVFLLGVVLAVAVGVEIWTSPRPRDHSQVSVPDTAGVEDSSLVAQRASWVASSTTSSLAIAITGIAIAVGGSAWVAMMAADAWRLLLPIAAVIVALVVIGDQIGASWQGQALWALTAGLVAGITGAVLMIAVGQGGTLGNLVLPTIAQFLGTQLAVVALSAGTGVVIAIAVVVIDAVFGEHELPSDILAAASRGASKFLLCGLVIYTVIRVAGA